MANVGLILGGGGLVGIAWELGVMSGLQASGGFDPLDMKVIVGSSAGSVAGAVAALGKDLASLVESQQRTSDRPASSGQRPFTFNMEIMRLFTSTEGTVEERAAAIGPLAIEADVGLSEDDYVESFRPMLGTDDWPSVDFRATTAECRTGRSVLWSRDSGIGLLRAVASSCAIPGYFPTVAFGGERYMDGPRGGFYADLVSSKKLDALLSIAPMEGMPGPLAASPEIDELAAAGLPMVRISGGPALAADVTNLMNPAARAPAAAAGLEGGRAAGAAFAAMASG
jgi:NTE family protein